MIKELTKLANHLDAKGLRKEADYLDALIRKVADDTHNEIVAKEEWMNYADGSIRPNGNLMLDYHNGEKREYKSGDPVEGRPLKGGPDKDGNGAATMVFFKLLNTGYQFDPLIDSDGDIIGYGYGNGAGWKTHFHKPSNGWPDGLKLKYEISDKPPHFHNNLWTLPAPAKKAI